MKTALIPTWLQEWERGNQAVDKEVEMIKKWYQSKTLYLNAIGAAVAIVQALQGQTWIDPEIQVLILAVLNALLRFITKASLTK